jgi:hypothetical protein
MWNKVTKQSVLWIQHHNLTVRGFVMISVGINVAKDKHDCFIINSEGEVLADVFTIPNNIDGFQSLLQKIRSSSSSQDKIKVGLEATGHYSYNILTLAKLAGHAKGDNINSESCVLEA